MTRLEDDFRYTDHTEFPLTVGGNYSVYAMSFYQRAINLLVCHDNFLPSWHPLELFEIVDSGLPSDWEFQYFFQGGVPVEGRQAASAIWGYHEIVHSDEHYVGLIERDPQALQVFHDERMRREHPDG